jgi:hypothetical protein
MAKSSKRNAPVLPPGTYIVDNPNWNEDAPEVELAEQPQRAYTAAPTKPKHHAPTIVERPTGLVAMIAMGVVLLAGVGVGGWWLLEQRDEEVAKQVEAKVEAEAAAEAAAVAAVPATAPPTIEDLETEYAKRVALTAAELGIEAPSVASLLEPNAFENPVTHGKPVVLAPGATKRFGPLNLKVRVDTLSLDRHEIRSKGEHTVLQIHNTADHPVAYRLNVRKKSNGDCLSLAVFNYDAMVIDAGAKTDISICSGRQSAEILDFRMLSITPIGARWIRQIPPLAVGNTAIAARSHKLADADTPQCNEDAADMARAMEEHLVRWEDVIDFFSRHDCRKYAWVSEWRLAKQPLTRLPILPQEPSP